MKKYSLYILTIVSLLISCTDSKEDYISPNKGKEVAFSVSVENGNHKSRTVYGSEIKSEDGSSVVVNWVDGDKITVYAPDCSVKQAGGFIIQLMPFTSDEVIEKLEQRISTMDSVTNMLERGLSPEGILEEILGDFGLEITDKLDTQFYCDCSKEKVSRALSTINKKDLDDIINDGESIEVKCQFCNKAYNFDIDELKVIREA